MVIPVYHAERFVRDAIDSALAQDEVHEVLVIDDGSTDNTLAICRMYGDPRVRVWTHPGGINLGIAASRNLGIGHASGDFVAFLDADDLYLPNRFKGALQVMAQYPDADGVYETVEVFADDPVFTHAGIATTGHRIGLRKDVTPGGLFNALAAGRYGYIHLNGLIVKRSTLTQPMRLDTAFRQCEDSDFILRLSRYCRLYGGNTRHPVAMRRIHGHNTVHDMKTRLHFRRKYLKKCMDQGFYGAPSVIANLYLISRYFGTWRAFQMLRRYAVLAMPLKCLFVSGYLITHPRVLWSLIRNRLSAPSIVPATIANRQSATPVSSTTTAAH